MNVNNTLATPYVSIFLHYNIKKLTLGELQVDLSPYFT